jgi:hypothetical protein
MPFSFTVDPGLRVTTFDVLECSHDALKRFSDFPPHDKIIGLLEPEDEAVAYSAYCLCVCDVINETAHPFHLQVNPDTTLLGEDKSAFFSSKSFITLESMAVRRVIVAMRKFTVPQSEFPVIEPALRKYLTKEKGFTEQQFAEFQALEIYSIKLFSRFMLQWHAVVNNGVGHLPLDAIRLTREQMQRVMKQDVVVDIRLKSTKATSNELIELEAFVLNVGDLALDRLDVSLVPTLLLSSFSFSWVNKINNVAMPLIPPGAADSVSFTICFHEKGRFELVALCRDANANKEFWSKKVHIEVNSVR